MSSPERTAKLEYGPNAFRVIQSGDHVLCAVTGEAISLESLRYWCVVRQEAYASPAIATRRLMDTA